MNPQQIISANIKRIRSSRGLSIIGAAKAAGLSRNAFSAIERGLTKEPRVSNLQSIADMLNVQLMDLFAESPKLFTVRFRSNSIKTSKDLAKKEQYLIDVAFWLKDFNFLQSLIGDRKEYKLESVCASISKLRTDRLLKAAELTRDAVGLKNDEPIGDIVGLVESMGIKIKTREFDIKNFFGFSVSQSDGGPAIVVNISKNITVERRIFTVAHELGHLLLHPRAYDLSKSQESIQEENEANCFAGYFLMPEDAFAKKWKESYGLGFIERVLHIKRFFDVSYQTVLYRLSEMKVDDYGKLTAKFLYIYINKYGKSLKKNEEPQGLTEFDFVEDYLRLLVRKCLNKELITVSRAAEILNVSLLDMRNIINSWEEIAA